tara:strand:+ start:18353 stop:18892 length:540 start_codon:yes stop_codon:yes gene_type:complete
MAIHKIDGGPGGETNHFPKKFVTLYTAAGIAIAKGDWVAIDLDDSTNGLGASVEQSTVALPQLVFGVATEAKALNDSGNIRVQVAGYYGHEDGSSATLAAGEGANVETSVAAGDFIVASLTTAGRAQEVDNNAIVVGNSQANIQTAMRIARVGIALEAAGANNYGANETGVMIIDQGYF